jgi:hypothetical protein
VLQPHKCTILSNDKPTKFDDDKVGKTSSGKYIITLSRWEEEGVLKRNVNYHEIIAVTDSTITMIYPLGDTFVYKKISSENKINPLLNKKFQGSPQKTISAFYDSFVWGNEKFDENVGRMCCTSKLLQRLNISNANISSPNHYTIENFSLTKNLALQNNEKLEPRQINHIEPTSYDWYIVELEEYGYHGTIKIKIIKSDSNYLIDDYLWIDKASKESDDKNGFARNKDGKPYIPDKRLPIPND